MNLGPFMGQQAENGVNPMDFIDPFKFSKRDFLMELFKEYNNLPLQKSLANLAKVYNDVFVRDTPSLMATYALFEIQVAEISNVSTADESMDGNLERLSIPFKFNFTTTTSKHVDYTKSQQFLEAL